MSLVPLPRRTLSWRKLSCQRKITRRRVTQAPGGIVLVLAHAHATGHLHQDLLGAVDPLQDITGRGRRVVVAKEARMARMAAVMTIMGVTRTSEQKVAQRRKSELCSAWISFVIVRSELHRIDNYCILFTGKLIHQFGWLNWRCTVINPSHKKATFSLSTLLLWWERQGLFLSHFTWSFGHFPDCVNKWLSNHCIYQIFIFLCSHYIWCLAVNKCNKSHFIEFFAYWLVLYFGRSPALQSLLSLELSSFQCYKTNLN